jgi:hypothetical protein
VLQSKATATSTDPLCAAPASIQYLLQTVYVICNFNTANAFVGSVIDGNKALTTAVPSETCTGVNSLAQDGGGIIASCGGVTSTSTTAVYRYFHGGNPKIIATYTDCKTPTSLKHAFIETANILYVSCADGLSVFSGTNYGTNTPLMTVGTDPVGSGALLGSIAVDTINSIVYGSNRAQNVIYASLASDDCPYPMAYSVTSGGGVKCNGCQVAWPATSAVTLSDVSAGVYSGSNCDAFLLTSFASMTPSKNGTYQCGIKLDPQDADGALNVTLYTHEKPDGVSSSTVPAADHRYSAYAHKGNSEKDLTSPNVCVCAANHYGKDCADQCKCDPGQTCSGGVNGAGCITAGTLTSADRDTIAGWVGSAKNASDAAHAASDAANAAMLSAAIANSESGNDNDTTRAWLLAVTVLVAFVVVLLTTVVVMMCRGARKDASADSSSSSAAAQRYTSMSNATGPRPRQ